LLTGLLSSVTVLVVVAYLENRAAALIAFLIPLVCLPFVRDDELQGPSQSWPMITFGCWRFCSREKHQDGDNPHIKPGLRPARTSIEQKRQKAVFRD